MSTMTEEEKQARIAEFKKTPQKVQVAALVAFALGVVTFLRVIARAYATQLQGIARKAESSRLVDSLQQFRH